MATKNRDGKPTEFQKRKLRDLGYNKRVKTYREAENAIKRLENANKAKADRKPIKKDDANPIPKPGVVRIGYLVLSEILPVVYDTKKERK